MELATYICLSILNEGHPRCVQGIVSFPTLLSTHPLSKPQSYQPELLSKHINGSSSRIDCSISLSAVYI